MLTLKILVHSTGSPVPDMKGRNVKCISVVDTAGAALSPTFFGMIKSPPSTLLPFSWLALHPVSSTKRRNLGLVSTYFFGNLDCFLYYFCYSWFHHDFIDVVIHILKVFFCYLPVFFFLNPSQQSHFLWEHLRIDGENLYTTRCQISQWNSVFGFFYTRTIFCSRSDPDTRLLASSITVVFISYLFFWGECKFTYEGSMSIVDDCWFLL